jgi:uncharacterized protein
MAMRNVTTTSQRTNWGAQGHTSKQGSSPHEHAPQHSTYSESSPTPVKRDVYFALDPEKIRNWNSDSPHLTHFLNTLSLFFPHGERFFIQSVRIHMDDLPAHLRAAAQAFIAQEALHGREHERHNDLFAEYFPQGRDTERFVGRLLKAFQTKAPKKAQLATTMALEHLTAIMAEGLLADPRVREGMNETYRDLWLWHALEETEHKAVAFDIWLHVYGREASSYARRSFALVHSTAMLTTLVTATFVRALAKEGVLTDWQGWKVFGHHMFGELGFLRKLALPWLSYLRPNFHPWDHDNRERLTMVDAIAERYARKRSAPNAAA